MFHFILFCNKSPFLSLFFFLSFSLSLWSVSIKVTTRHFAALMQTSFSWIFCNCEAISFASQMGLPFRPAKPAGYWAIEIVSHGRTLYGVRSRGMRIISLTKLISPRRSQLPGANDLASFEARSIHWWWVRRTIFMISSLIRKHIIITEYLYKNYYI